MLYAFASLLPYGRKLGGKKLWRMNLAAELAKKTLANGPCCRFSEKKNFGKLDRVCGKKL